MAVMEGLVVGLEHRVVAAEEGIAVWRDRVGRLGERERQEVS